VQKPFWKDMAFENSIGMGGGGGGGLGGGERKDKIDVCSRSMNGSIKSIHNHLKNDTGSLASSYAVLGGYSLCMSRKTLLR